MIRRLALLPILALALTSCGGDPEPVKVDGGKRDSRTSGEQSGSQAGGEAPAEAPVAPQDPSDSEQPVDGPALIEGIEDVDDKTGLDWVMMEADGERGDIDVLRAAAQVKDDNLIVVAELNAALAPGAGVVLELGKRTDEDPEDPEFIATVGSSVDMVSTDNQVSGQGAYKLGSATADGALVNFTIPLDQVGDNTHWQITTRLAASDDLKINGVDTINTQDEAIALPKAG